MLSFPNDLLNNVYEPTTKIRNGIIIFKKLGFTNCKVVTPKIAPKNDIGAKYLRSPKCILLCFKNCKKLTPVPTDAANLFVPKTVCIGRPVNKYPGTESSPPPPPIASTNPAENSKNAKRISVVMSKLKIVITSVVCNEKYTCCKKKSQIVLNKIYF